VIGHHAIHGHALVSADDRIADADGAMPPMLFDPVDWRRFQAALSASVAVVLGRLGHETHPNTRERNRVVVSAGARGLERRADAWWWNPADVTVEEALAAAAPEPGVVAVPGGCRVFDLFLTVGYDRFDLARAAQITLPGGVPVFSAVAADGIGAEAILARHGLAVASREVLDADASVSLASWRRAARA